MTYYYPDMSSGPDWLCQAGTLLRPIRDTTQIWTVIRHDQYGISALFHRRHFRRRETSGVVAKYRLFSQGTQYEYKYYTSIFFFLVSKHHKSLPSSIQLYRNDKWRISHWQKEVQCTVWCLPCWLEKNAILGLCNLTAICLSTKQPGELKAV